MIRTLRTRAVYKSLLIVVAVLLGVTTRRRYAGLRRVPVRGAAIVVCNHISVADPLVLTHALSRAGRLPRGLATAGLFRAPVVGRLFTSLGFIPVHRGTADAGSALAGAAAALDAGELVMLYPEGGIPDARATDGWVGPLKTGAARLSMTTGTPIVPAAQWGIQRVLPPATRAPWLRALRSAVLRPRVRVIVGEPIVLLGDPDDRDDVRAATLRIQAAMNDLLVQLRPGVERPDPATVEPVIEAAA